MAGTPHVVILGAGFGGVGAALKLRDAAVRISIIDKHDYHTFQPLLYQVATQELEPTAVGYPIRELLHRHDNVAFHNCTVQSVDLAKKQVVVDGMPPLEYDYLVLALGALVNFHGTPGAAEYALPLYTMNDAIRLHDHILKTLEAVDKNPALVDDGALNFCIIGGGPTGTELAGALAELLHTELKADYPNLPIDEAQVIVYEHSPHLLAPFKPKLRDYAQKTLEERGVEVQTSCGVAEVGPSEITLASGEKVKTHTLVWAAGLQANPIAASLGIELAPGGRVPVGPDLQVKDHPGVFAIGDIASTMDAKTDKPLPGLAAVALQAGHYVGETIAHLVEGKPVKPFHYHDKGTMAQVARGAAVVELPTGGTLTGRVAWLAWLGIHLSLLSNAEEKTSVFVDWGWNLLTNKRGKRIILSDEEHEESL
ncbi:NAD(P)/FAD-dependent oxidoreductase [Bythopirellula polymerisocia]|uniref:NADH:ubiquinone reductase (non-electrogenic) n=1 Tax=Bythopirellula polymerisocia TaxID=2528003 RepID=A0A5C6D1N5_9BACT|nr:NAD(P)/FAD-dependent oxidoreductase [Bythopirellula polymerisocia]TWU29671.1 NADH dehydrogenase-like protein YjlD [Bythopirellula polymerisocia]